MTSLLHAIAMHEMPRGPILQARNNLLALRLLREGGGQRGQLPQEVLQAGAVEGRAGLWLRRQRLPLRVRDEAEDLRVSE